jgi:hypothetical protein
VGFHHRLGKLESATGDGMGGWNWGWWVGGRGCVA